MYRSFTINAQFLIKNGGNIFILLIKEKNIELDEILVPLDVTSLFNNISKELVMRGIENRWNDIKRTTKLNLSQFLRAIELVLCSTSFSFNGKFYEQIYGSPMGSPLSPVLADVVMEDLELYCLKKLDFTVHTYYRYVDDIFMIIPRAKLDTVLKTFNEYHSRLKFTYEVESNDALNFLNTSVMRENGKLITNWFRKPTFSGRYINFFSYHPEQYKVNTIANLVDQAILLSDEIFHAANIEIIKTILLNNCYPIGLINEKIDDRLRAIRKNRISKNRQE